MPDGFTKSHQPVEDVTGALCEQGDSQRSDADSLASHLIAMLGEDAKERQQWRHQVLKAVENVLSIGSVEPSLAFGVCTSVVDPPSKASVSLSEVVHEQSLLTLTELFADADPKELELIRSFVLKFSSAQLLRAGLLVRQSSLPAFTSPPFNNTSCQNGAISLHTDALKSFGPMRRSKSHSHAEIHKPYRTRRGRRLYSLQLSPGNTDDEFSSARRVSMLRI
ncbi:hypothetical protein FGIG_12071 [Fasciola gigantica]|uniref:Uncharacterized protein n=1 Tax=Fasciola gigantica TaxID=46835 RepID=A0A504Z5H6_FASGI|nr:hypothetical protein FGIG_12071 [Fasciola gigantica]